MSDSEDSPLALEDRIDKRTREFLARQGGAPHGYDTNHYVPTRGPVQESVRVVGRKARLCIERTYGADGRLTRVGFREDERDDFPFMPIPPEPDPLSAWSAVSATHGSATFACDASNDPGIQPIAPSIDDRIDDLIDRWHEGEGRGMPLSAWLGMTWDEYKAWAEDASCLPDGYTVPERGKADE